MICLSDSLSRELAVRAGRGLGSAVQDPDEELGLLPAPIEAEHELVEVALEVVAAKKFISVRGQARGLASDWPIDEKPRPRWGFFENRCGPVAGPRVARRLLGGCRIQGSRLIGTQAARR